MTLETLKNRFWEFVDKESQAPCWVWMGVKGQHKNGFYGSVQMKGKNYHTHRLSWLFNRGPIPDDGSYHGVCVLHTCDNPPCVRPDHLFLGRNSDNQADKAKKGRGGVNPMNRLKTHCKNGHPFDEANTTYLKKGERQCRTCRNAYDRTRRRKQALAATEGQ